MKNIAVLLVFFISLSTFAQVSPKLKEETETDFCPAFNEILADAPNDYKQTVGQEKTGDEWDLQKVMPGAMRLYKYENMEGDVAFLMDANHTLPQVKEDYDKLMEWVKVCLGGEGYTYKERYSPGDIIKYSYTVTKNDTRQTILKLKILDNTDNMEVSGITHEYYCVLEFM